MEISENEYKKLKNDAIKNSVDRVINILLLILWFGLIIYSIIKFKFINDVANSLINPISYIQNKTGLVCFLPK